jgi:hypothetical protein
VHPTIRNANARLHSGMVGPFTRRVSEKLGGASLFLPGALGDQTPDKGFGVNGIGNGLADALVEDVERGGYVLQTNDIAVARTSVQIPIENQFFVAALGVGYAVRDFLPPYGGGPHAVATENEGTNLRSCESRRRRARRRPDQRDPLRRQAAGRARSSLGPEYKAPVETDNVVVVQSPGEIFASIGLIVKDYLSRSNNVLVQGVTNDTLGYIIPANQYDLFASQGLGIANNAAETGNYEEALSLGPLHRRDRHQRDARHGPAARRDGRGRGSLARGTRRRGRRRPRRPGSPPPRRPAAPRAPAGAGARRRGRAARPAPQDGDADQRHRRREAQAEGGDERQARTPACPGEGGQQDEQRGGRGQQPARRRRARRSPAGSAARASRAARRCVSWWWCWCPPRERQRRASSHTPSPKKVSPVTRPIVLESRAASGRGWR